MAERSKGPVKPPTLDLTARAGSAGKTGAEPPPDAAKPGNTDAPKQTPPPADAAGGRPAYLVPGLSALGGGVLGLVLAFAFAGFGLWPASPAGTSDLAAMADRLNGLASQVARETTRNEKLEADIAATKSDLAANTTRTAAAIGQLREDLAGLPEPAAPDLSAITTDVASLRADLDALSDRLDALAATPTADGTLSLPALTDLQTRVTTLDTALKALQQKTAATDTAVTGLRTDLATLAARPQPAPQQSVAAATRLTLALSGLDKALRTGAPYAAELAALRTALPDADIADVLASHATTGLPAPSPLAAAFTAAVPGMLAKKPIDPQASWTDRLLERLKTLIALRPADATSGDSPEAVISRIETSLANAEFSAADRLFLGLPAPMQDAAGATGTDLALLAAAEDNIAALRLAALDGGDNAGDDSGDGAR